jgi:hypothetical protein
MNGPVDRRALLQGFVASFLAPWFTSLFSAARSRRASPTSAAPPITPPPTPGPCERYYDYAIPSGYQTVFTRQYDARGRVTTEFFPAA